MKILNFLQIELLQLFLLCSAFAWENRKQNYNANEKISTPFNIVHGSLNSFQTNSQYELNQLCPISTCGPFCAQNSCANANPERYDIQFNNFNMAGIDINSISTDQNTLNCIDSTNQNCCLVTNEICTRTLNVYNSIMTNVNEDVLILFGGIIQKDQLNSNNNQVDIYLQQKCMTSIAASPECLPISNITNNVYMYFLGQNKWVTPVKPLIAPSERYGHSAVTIQQNYTYDFKGTPIQMIKKFLYVYGGISNSCQQSICGDMWAFEVPFSNQRYYPYDDSKPQWDRGGTWMQVQVANYNAGPMQRAHFSFVTDNANEYVYLFGGMSFNATTGKQYFTNDLYRFSISSATWQQVSYFGIQSISRVVTLWDGTLRTSQVHPALRIDSVDLTQFAKNSGRGCQPQENSEFDFSQTTVQYKKLNQQLLYIPSCRAGAVMTFDANGESLFIFGGIGDDQTFTNDVWQIPIKSLQLQCIYFDQTKQQYPQAQVAGLLMDPNDLSNKDDQILNKQLFLFGGQNQSNYKQDEVWSFNYVTRTWQQIRIEEEYFMGIMDSVSDLVNANVSELQQFYSQITFNRVLYAKYSSGISLFVGNSLQYEAIQQELLDSLQQNSQLKLNSQVYTFSLQDSCDPQYVSRGTCMFGIMKCNAGYFGLQCENRMCPNSYCLHDINNFKIPECQFCSGNGNCLDGFCLCTLGHASIPLNNQSWIFANFTKIKNVTQPLEYYMNLVIASQQEMFQPNLSNTSITQANNQSNATSTNINSNNTNSTNTSLIAINSLIELIKDDAFPMLTDNKCSISDCSANNCSSSSTNTAGACIQQAPQSQCNCDQMIGADDCSFTFCLNSCSQNGVCLNGQCLCKNMYRGSDCGILFIDILAST